MKKILVITYYWPPSGGSGVQRWMYFCKYLPRFGYDPIVLTVSENKASYRNIDSTFSEKVKDVKTYKTNTLEPLKLYSLISSGSRTKGIPQGHVATHKKGFFHKISSYIRGNFFIPDARIGWKFFALKKAREIINTENIDLVVTTGPPHSTHLIGLQLKKEFPIKWIADLRDPWVDIYYNIDMKRSKRAQKKDQFLEAQVLHKADKILTVGSKLKKLLQNKTHCDQNKFYHIYNGYDSFLMEEVVAQHHEHFEITFIGLLTQNQPYKNLTQILKSFLEKCPNANFKLCLAGNIEKEILNTLEKEFTSSRVIHKGYIDHGESIKLMKSSQILINLLAEMPNNEILISGKLMEYIATGNPVLCIGNIEGESALILKAISNARIFEKQQIEESSKFLVDLYKKWEKGISCINNVEDESIKSKSRFATTRKLSELLNQL